LKDFRTGLHFMTKISSHGGMMPAMLSCGWNSGLSVIQGEVPVSSVFQDVFWVTSNYLWQPLANRNPYMIKELLPLCFCTSPGKGSISFRLNSINVQAMRAHLDFVPYSKSTLTSPLSKTQHTHACSLQPLNALLDTYLIQLFANMMQNNCLAVGVCL
jgi:hypothetical protein